MPTPRLIHINQIDKDSIEKAFDLNKRTEKIITFIYPSITEGAIGSFYKFPFNGEVKRIDAYCVDSSVVDTIFTVEKVSEEDFAGFLDAFTSFLYWMPPAIPRRKSATRPFLK